MENLSFEKVKEEFRSYIFIFKKDKNKPFLVLSAIDVEELLKAWNT